MSIGFNDQFIIEYNEGGLKTIPSRLKKCCKILKFSFDCSYDEILLCIAELCANDFPFLYHFIFGIKNIELYENGDKNLKKVTTIEKFLIKFDKMRPMIMQIVSEDEITHKIFYKVENVYEFYEINHESYNIDELHHFPNFYSLYINGGVKIIDSEMIDKIIKKENSSLILRVLRTLNISDDSLIRKLILKCAATCSKNQLLAALDIAFEFKKHELNDDAIDYLENAFYVSESDELEQSIILTAVESQNSEIVNFLLNNFKPLILKLPIGHQMDISNIAFDTNQIEILCNLIDCDFPFPDDFDASSINDKRLTKITNDRKNFHQWIEDKNFINMEDFIEDNYNLKMIYNIQNESALNHALNSKKFDVYYHLKSFGLQGENLSFEQVAENQKELKQVEITGLRQRRRNVLNALPNEDNAVMILITRCLIHNQIMSDKGKFKYRSNIEKWFKEINRTKFGSKIMHVVSQCEDLKIILDFENENVSLFYIYLFFFLDSNRGCS